MKIALYQFTPLRGDIAGNLEKIERTIHPYTDIDLWILPELATTGYLFESRETLLSLAESFPGGRTGKWLGSLSRNQNTAIVIGVAEKAGNRLLNSAVVYSAGEQVSVYRKIHLFDNEKRLFDAGAQPPPVVEIGGVHVGVMICFDWIFPELTRSLALSGAQLIAHPSNLVLPYCPDAMITRSIENRIFTATANRTGRENTQDGRVLNFIGCSQITDVHGNLLGRLTEHEEAVLVAEIDAEKARDKQITDRNHLFQDRKPFLYYSN